MTIALLLAAALTASAPNAPAPVQTEGGTVQGVLEEGVYAYKQLPYAAPPVGALRWRPPQPVAPWSGVRDAAKLGPDCLQGDMPGSGPPPPRSEDCLHLNIWRPADATVKRPVMVWIHGGAFTNGGSSSPETHGAAMARRGLVFVSFNYRLGRLGFFGFPALSQEHPEEPKVNYGLMDQVAALEWVRRNIADFGGDPANVTVVGESAGGISVNMLLTSPVGADLFDKAIVQSGGGRGFLAGERRVSQDLPHAPSAETLGLALADALGVTAEGPAALAQLRAKSAEQITGNLSMATLVFAPSRAYFPGPVIDGRLLVEPIETAFRAGRQHRKPLIVGATDADLSLERARSPGEAFAAFGPDAGAAQAAYDPEGRNDMDAINAAIGADRLMVEPARFVARSMSALGAPVYAYRFAYVPAAKQGTARHGAEHATDVAFAFDRLDAALGASVTPLDREVARRMADYWANFARHGAPGEAGAPAWPPYDAQSDKILVVQPTGRFRAVQDPWRVRLDLTESRSARP